MILVILYRLGSRTHVSGQTLGSDHKRQSQPSQINISSNGCDEIPRGIWRAERNLNERYLVVLYRLGSRTRLSGKALGSDRKRKSQPTQNRTYHPMAAMKFHEEFGELRGTSMKDI
jgi:hypothetical protein